MSNVIKVAIGLAIAVLVTVPADAATCGRYGGWGIGITQDIAKFMSDKATHQAMEKDNAKPVTAIATKCNTDAMLYWQCHSTTKACAK